MQKIASVEGVSQYTLPNGLEVLICPDESKPTVTVNIAYLVGSRHEGYGETGMAHLLEHMLFKGTPSHPHIWKELQDHGAQFNGTTSYDRTNYYETLTAGDDNLAFALSLEADRMVNSHVAKPDLDSEMTVVRNEFEIGENQPLAVLSERVRSTAFLWHNYGKSTIGSREDIERVPIERLQAFYRRFYQPDNAVLIVAGKFDEQKTLALIQDRFGKIPRPTRALEKTYTVEPPQDGEREVTLRRTGDVQAIACVYHICAAAHDDSAPLDVLASVLTADQTGRLYKALIETKLATSVSADAEALCEPGVFDVTVQARADQAMDRIRSTLVAELDRLRTETFTDEEVNRAKAQFARSFDLMMNDSQRLALRLTESVAAGDWRLMFLHRDRLASVTPADLARVASLYLRPSNRTVGVFVPEKAPERTLVPATPDVAALVKDYRGREAVASGAAFDLTYANIDAHTQRSTLPGGMRLALLPKQTRGAGVRAQIVFHYAAEADLTGKAEAATLVGPMLMRGSKQHTRRQIQDRLAELKAQLRMGGGGGMMGGFQLNPGALSVSLETTRENLMPVIELLTEILREPAFSSDEYEKLQKETLAQIEQQVSEPLALCIAETRRRMSPYPSTDIRYVPTPAEEIDRLKAVTLDQIKEVYGWIGAGAARVAVVGDFDAPELTAELTKRFRDWESKKRYERITSPYREVTPAAVVLATPDKASAMFAFGGTFALRDDDQDYPALVMANFVLGGSLNSRLMNRLRQKEGFSYGCGSALSASPFEPSAQFLAYGICAPENTEKAMVAAREEIDRFLKDGVTQDELNDARKGYREQQSVLLAQDTILATLLAQNLEIERTMQFSQKLIDRIEQLKPAEVVGMLAKHVKPDRLVSVRAGDFKKPPAQN